MDEKIVPFFRKKSIQVAREFFKKNIWLVLVLLVLVINGVLIYFNFFNKTAVLEVIPSVNTEAIEEPPVGMARSALTGEYVPTAVVTKRPYAVMIDNFPSARPPSGLSDASWVWETLVEGGVTRIMAVFQTETNVTIGPVRSAREYFLPLASELGAVYIHSGGSPAALAALADQTVVANGDEFANGYAFYRRSNLLAPHNLFTTIKKLDDLVIRREWEQTVGLRSQTFSDEVPQGGEKADVVRVDFSVPDYAVTWRWDNDARRYERVANGIVSTDRENAKILSASTVVVEFTKVTSAPRPNVPDAVTVNTVGSGEAKFFRNGQTFVGRWEKSNTNSSTQYFDNNNKPFIFARGPVWVEIVSDARNNAVIIE